MGSKKRTKNFDDARYSMTSMYIDSDRLLNLVDFKYKTHNHIATFIFSLIHADDVADGIVNTGTNNLLVLNDFIFAIYISFESAESNHGLVCIQAPISEFSLSNLLRIALIDISTSGFEGHSGFIPECTNESNTLITCDI